MACAPLDSGTDSCLDSGAVDDTQNRTTIASATDFASGCCLGCHKYSLLVERALLDSVDILDTFANLPTVCSGMLGY